MAASPRGSSMAASPRGTGTARGSNKYEEQIRGSLALGCNALWLLARVVDRDKTFGQDELQVRQTARRGGRPGAADGQSTVSPMMADQ